MTRRTLLDFFADVTATAPRRTRSFSPTTTDIARGPGPTAISAPLLGFAAAAAADITAGKAIAIWSENRPEWIAAMWGALLEGVVVVPIDYRASADFLLKVAGIVDAKAILVGDAVDAPPLGAARRVAPARDLPPKAEATKRTSATRGHE